ncbi:MAG: tetratricopeptide repeat protein [Deltaproteobacteria bacterium]|nr:tetratricopeptide repeat protein [Deltaproteobacteria bacterium]
MSRTSLMRLLAHPLTPLALAAALCTAAYANALGGQFVFDDIVLVRDAPHVHDITHFGRMLSAMGESEGIGYRPVRTLTHMIEYQVFGPRAWGYHLTNVLLHLAVCLLLFRLCRRFGLGELASLASMAIFALHPVHTESVAYISGRRDLLYALFFTAGMLAYIRGVREKSRLLVFAALPLYVLGVFSKEQAVTLPVVLYLWDVLVHRRREAWPVRLWRPFQHQPVFWAIIWAGALAFFLYRGVLLPRTSQPDWWGGSPAVNFATALAVHARYLLVQIWPVDLLADYSAHAFPLAQGFLDRRTVLGILLLLASLAIAVASTRRAPLLSLAIISYWVLLLPVSHIIPHHELAAEHHLYLPSASLCLIAGAGLAALAKRRRIVGWGLLVLLLPLLLGLTISRNRVWRSEESLWADTVRKAPRCARALFNLAIVHIKRDDLDSGEDLLRRSLIEKDFPRGRAYLANVLTRKGRYAQAHDMLSNAIQADPDDLYVVKYHCQNLIHLGLSPEALPLLEKAVTTWPRDADMHFMLSGTYLALGRPGEALSESLTVLSLRPDDERTRKIAVLIAGKLGKADLARKLEAGWSPDR